MVERNGSRRRSTECSGQHERHGQKENDTQTTATRQAGGPDGRGWPRTGADVSEETCSRETISGSVRRECNVHVPLDGEAARTVAEDCRTPGHNTVRIRA